MKNDSINMNLVGYIYMYSQLRHSGKCLCIIMVGFQINVIIAIVQFKLNLSTTI